LKTALTRPFFLPGSFEDFNGLKNDTTEIVFKVLGQRDYGTLKFSVKLPSNDRQYILQLMDEKDVVQREFILTKSEQLFLENLKPNSYKFKLIFDSNQNKKWDTGKFLTKRHAEKVLNYPQTLIVRANWDMNEVWDATK